MYLNYVLNKKLTWLKTWQDTELTSEELEKLKQLIGRRKNGEPIAYITGEKTFWSLTLETNSSTLIPRPETELLVEKALNYLATKPTAKLLDLGTGTGAIALAIASERKNDLVFACDYVEEAVKLAIRNTKKNNIENVSIIQSDWFSSIDLKDFDLIISNPPYIDPEDEHLSRGDVRFEPLTALIAEDHGLADIRNIIKQAVSYLSPLGWLMFEHGYDQGESVRKLFNEHGFVEIATYQDLGGNDRVTIGRLPEQGVTEHSRGG